MRAHNDASIAINRGCDRTFVVEVSHARSKYSKQSAGESRALLSSAKSAHQRIREDLQVLRVHDLQLYWESETNKVDGQATLISGCGEGVSQHLLSYSQKGNSTLVQLSSKVVSRL